MCGVCGSGAFMRQSEDTTLGPEDDAEAGRAGQEHEETPDQPAQQVACFVHDVLSCLCILSCVVVLFCILCPCLHPVSFAFCRFLLCPVGLFASWLLLCASP